MILPVWVATTHKPQHKKLVYAMRLHVGLPIYNSDSGKKERVNIGTMIGGSEPTVINKYTNLLMKGSNKEVIDIADFEWINITCNKSQIPTQQHCTISSSTRAH